MLPVRMTRVLVTGPKDLMEDTITLLHSQAILHVDDFQDPTGLTTRGTPLTKGDDFSAALVKVRGLQSTLAVSGRTGRTLATDNPFKWVQDGEAEIMPAVEKAAEQHLATQEIQSQIESLMPFKNLQFDLGAAKSLRSVKVRLGICKQDPSKALAGRNFEFESLHDAQTGATMAVSRSDAIDRELQSIGFVASNIAAGIKGTPAEAIATLEAKSRQLVKDQEATDAKLELIRNTWGDKLASLERYFSAEVEKTSVPLQFATTRRMFIAEGWIPAASAQELGKLLNSNFKGSVVLENLGDAPKNLDATPKHESGHEGHSHHGDHGTAHAHDAHDHHESSAADEAPIKLNNGRIAKPFEFMIGLLGKPRYNELDPTKLMAFFFPLFFGLMVGDIVVGLAIVAFGIYLKKNYLFGIGGPAVGKALMYGGIVSIIVGALVFGEAMGLHFVVQPEFDAASGEFHFEEMSWETIIYGEADVLAGGGFSCEGLVSKNHCVDFTHAVHHEDSQDGGLLSPHADTRLEVAGAMPLGIYSKIHDVQPLLILSCLIGIVHLVLGIVLGIRNVYVSHGLKLAIQEKVSWLMIIFGLGAVAFTIGDKGAFFYGALAVSILGIALLWMGVQHTLGAGFISILEVPGFAGNVLSYTRIAAIGASKAGMAVAFSAIAFDMVGGAAGWIIYVLAFVGITILAILAGSLQSLRLQFVEFFSKFFVGGGRDYAPFGGKNN